MARLTAGIPFMEEAISPVTDTNMRNLLQASVKDSIVQVHIY